MAPVPKSTTNTPTTHQHQYFLHHSDHHHHQAYLCHACKTSGCGDRFRCHVCIVDVHTYCANCPHELSSLLHAHPLNLMVRNPQVESRNRRTCDVCRESIHGNFYRCKDCHFHVHPLCTQLPEYLRHVIDPNHKLRLHKLSSAPAALCSVCKADCSSLWVYACGVCNLNIHLNCLRKPFGSRSEKTDGPSGSRGFPGGAFPHAYAWGYPNYYFGHPGPAPAPLQFAYNSPNHQPNHGGHGHGYGYESSSSSLGSLVENTMFSLVRDLGMGALTDFIFGSFGF